MRHAFDGNFVQEREQGLHVNARRREQCGPERGSIERRIERRFAARDDLADQREAVGMRAARGQADDHVAGNNAAAIDDAALFDHTHRKSGEIVFAVGIHARHFRGFAADQRATGLFAARGDPTDHLRRDIHIELAARKIIEKEERLGALHQHVVDAHGDEIDADRVVPIEFEGQLQLGADTVGSGNQHGLAKALADLDQTAKTANARQHLRAHRALGHRFDALDQRIARIDVDACIAVGKGSMQRERRPLCLCGTRE